MQAAAVQTSPRVPPPARMTRFVTVLTPQVDYARFASPRRKADVIRPYPGVVQGLVKNRLAKSKDAPRAPARVVIFVLLQAGGLVSP
jgi:hypothetical protein